MTRAAILLSALFLACDTPRVDQLLVAGIQAVFEEPPQKPTGHAAECAKGADRYAAPNVVLLVDCNHVDAGRATR